MPDAIRRRGIGSGARCLEEFRQLRSDLSEGSQNVTVPHAELVADDWLSRAETQRKYSDEDRGEPYQHKHFGEAGSSEHNAPAGNADRSAKKAARIDDAGSLSSLRRRRPAPIANRPSSNITNPASAKD